MPPVAGSRVLISKAYRSWPASRRCTQGAKPATQLSAALASCLLGLDLSSSARYNSSPPPSTVDHRPSRRPPPALSFFRSAGTLLLLLLREARHLQLHPRFVSSRPQKTPCLVWSRIKRVSVSVFLLIFLVHCQSTSERKPQTTRAAQCLATSAHNSSQLRPSLSATGAIAIPCVDRLALAQSPRPPDARNSPERHSLFHLRLLPSPGRGKITQITQNVSINPPTRAHGSVS